MTPLGFMCALLLPAMLLIADSNVAFVPLPDWRSHSWLNFELERTLAVVRANMVELPRESEAAAVAQLASKVQMVSLETRQVAIALRALQTNYANLERERTSKFAELEKIIHQTQDEVGWLQKQQDEMKNQSAMTQRHLVKPNSYSAQRIAETRDDVINPAAWRNFLRSDNLTAMLSEKDETAVYSVEMMAMQIANGLRKTRQEALLSGQERSFTLDVDRRQFKLTAVGQPMFLDSDLDLSVYIAKSELIDDTIGSIRFFPDGSSTGGRVDLDLHGERATVVVNWSTGAVETEKWSGGSHLAQARATGHTLGRMR
jgi:general secretion pathway protein H